jgi:hypothetical protein
MDEGRVTSDGWVDLAAVSFVVKLVLRKETVCQIYIRREIQVGIYDEDGYYQLLQLLINS